MKVTPHPKDIEQCTRLAREIMEVVCTSKNGKAPVPGLNAVDSRIAVNALMVVVAEMVVSTKPDATPKELLDIADQISNEVFKVFIEMRTRPADRMRWLAVVRSSDLSARA